MILKSILRIFLVLSVITVFIACKEEKTTKSIDSENPLTETKANTDQSSTQSGNLKINPAHGQPGHRCDIKVGDPLPEANEAQTTITPSSNTQSPIIKNTGSVPLNTTTGSPKINPPHGQPGHRCDVKVGDPLE